MENKTNWTKTIIFAIVGLAIFGVLYGLVLNLYNQETEKRAAWLSAGADTNTTADRLDVTAAVLSVDPVKGEMVVRLDFFPKGELASADGWAATQDLTIITNSSLKPEIKFKKGQRLTATDMTLSLFDGLYTDYPFDRHTAELQVYANGSTPAKEGQPAEETALPISVEFSGFVHSFSLEGTVNTETTPDYAALDLYVTRSPSTVVWAVFVMILLWFMTLAVVGVTIFVVSSKRKLEFGSFAWIGGLLFAFVSFRGAAPGVPPLGSLIDFLAFFWAESIVAICLIIMVSMYLFRQPK
jgi:hypothetical protein